MLLDEVPWKAAFQVSAIALWFWAFRSLNLENATLVLNTSWFGAAFAFFTVLSPAAMPWIVPKTQMKGPMYRKVQATTAFLGGMNSALMVLSALVLRARGTSGEGGALFEEAEERGILFTAFAVGHFSQFAINVPSFLSTCLLNTGLVSPRSGNLARVANVLEWVIPTKRCTSSSSWTSLPL